MRCCHWRWFFNSATCLKAMHFMLKGEGCEAVDNLDGLRQRRREYWHGSSLRLQVVFTTFILRTFEVVVGVCDGSPQGLDSDRASATLKKCIQAV